MQFIGVDCMMCWCVLILTKIRKNRRVLCMNNEQKRMSIVLYGDTIKQLQELSESQGITQSEAFRKAIATEYYIRKEMSEGSKILLQKADKEIREVIFR